MTRVILKPRRARPFFARHPWLYANSIARLEGSAEPGDEVRVESAEGVFVARGLINPDSKLRVRLYRWDDLALDDGFWRERIASATAMRTELDLGVPSNAQRLIYSEGDGISGLIVDQFDRWLVVQFTSRALWQRREALTELIRSATDCAGGICRFDRAVSKLEGVEAPADEAFGTLPDGPVTIEEGGVRYNVSLGKGQKTGAYLDQCTNRAAATRYARNRRVLDAFCYTGGFGLHLLRNGGAASVLGIDSSEAAIAAARDNAALNSLGAIEFRVDDVFRALEQLQRAGERFGVVVCDPPKFARSAGDIDQALKGYARLNRAAIALLEPGGVLVTCSCSGLVDRTAFQDVLAHVSALAGRPIQVMEMRGQAPDHPVAVSCPESEYLKCAICRVE